MTTLIALDLQGGCLGSVLAGPISDILSIALARRRGGIQESEDKLWLFLIAIVLMPSGLILWGVGGAHGIHWIGLCFAAFMLGIIITFGVLLSIQVRADRCPFLLHLLN